MSLPDPEPDQPEQNKTKGKEKTTAKAREGRKGKRIRIRFFVGSLEPLLAARKGRRYNKFRRGSPLNADRDPNAGDDAAEEHPDQGGDVDVGAEADPDDDGVWPGEYMPVIPTIAVTEPDAEPEMVVARFTPEGVERDIGAAFAIGTAD